LRGAERGHPGKRLQLDHPAVLFDRELVLAKVGDRLIVAIQRDDVELDEIGGGRAGPLALSGRAHGQDDDKGRGDPLRHADAFRMTAMACWSHAVRSISASGTHRTSAASLPCTAARRRAAPHAAGVVDDDVVILGPSTGVAPDAVEDLHHRANGHVERRLLAHFPNERLLERLAELHRAARQAPLALERLLPALDQQHAIAVENHGSHGNNRPIGILPQMPITLTMTRFFRRPSNSA
jgi:hypothetical protein